MEAGQEVAKNQELFDLVGIARADGAVTGKPAPLQLARTPPRFRVLAPPLTTAASVLAVRPVPPAPHPALHAALTRPTADASVPATSRIRGKLSGRTQAPSPNRLSAMLK